MAKNILNQIDRVANTDRVVKINRSGRKNGVKTFGDTKKRSK